MNKPNPTAAALQKSGHRVTRQRMQVLDVIYQHGGHMTLEEVQQRLSALNQPIHLSTLYRTLNFLCELRLVAAAEVGGGKMVYEASSLVPHHHLVCRTCGQIIQISHAEVEGFFEQLFTQHAYQIDMNHLTLFGLCPACQAGLSHQTDQ